MSTISISATLTTDLDSFVRRRCPSCRFEFKIPEALRQSARYCPSCGRDGDVAVWHSDAQQRYFQALAAFHGQKLIQDELKKMSSRVNRSRGGLRVTTTSRPLGPEPRCPAELNDMTAEAMACCGRSMKLHRTGLAPTCVWCGPLAPAHVRAERGQ